MGLVNFIVDDEALEARVREYAGLVSANAPLTVRLCKAAVNEFERDPGERDLAKLDEMVTACFDSEDYKEGRRAFMEKAPPQLPRRVIRPPLHVPEFARPQTADRT